MTISSTVNRVSYTGNGVTTAFPFAYPFQLTSDLKVLLVTIADGTEVLQTINTHYTIPASTVGYPSGSTVTMLAAPSSLYKLVIYRDPALTQTIDLVENDALPAETLEQGLDKAILIAQRLSERLNRTSTLPEGFTGTFSPLLPSDISTPLATVVVNAAGDGFEMGPTSEEIADAEGFAVAAAASASAASTSASNASGSASAASTSETNAAASESAAAASASAASTSESNAAASESAAAASASAASTSASTATTQASNASTSASTASTQATNASNSASAASGSASAASTSASNAATSASNASTSETNAAASAVAAAASAAAADDKLISDIIENISFTVSMALNNMTVAIKDKTGVNCSVSSPGEVNFGNATLTNPEYVLRSLTAALSIVSPSGATHGCRAGINSRYYVFLIDDAGTWDVGLCRLKLREDELHTSVAISSGSILSYVLYSNSVRSNVRIRCIGEFDVNQATPGTHVTAANRLIVGKRSELPIQEVSAVMTRTSSFNPGTTAVTKTQWNSIAASEQGFDPLSLCDVSTNYRIISGITGKQLITLDMVMANFEASTTVQIFLYKNGSQHRKLDFLSHGVGTTRNQPFVIPVEATAATDYWEVYTQSGADTSYQVVGNTGVDSKAIMGLYYSL